MNTKKLASVFTALMLAMTVAGVAYAHWDELLIVDGYLNLGNMDVEESTCVWVGDYNDKPIIGDVATATVEGIPSIPDGVVREIVVTIDNAYPLLGGYIVIDFHNVGTVPAKLMSLAIRDPASPYINWEVMGWFNEEPAGQEGMACPEQLDPCHVMYLVIKFDITNEVLELSQYTFHIESVWYNWNEPDPYAGPPLAGIMFDPAGYYKLACYPPIV